MDDLIVKYNKKPIVGDLYTLSNLRVLLDDVLNEYLTRAGYKRLYVYQDIQNAIGIVSTVLGAAVTFLSMRYNFQAVKGQMSVYLAVYFVINAVSMLVKYREGRMYYYESFTISTRADDVPAYILLVYMEGKLVPLKYNKSMLDLFDETGKMDHDLFLNDVERLFIENK